MIIVLSLSVKSLGSISIMLQILLVFFNLMIFVVSLRENEKELLKSNQNVNNEEEITQ